jgi:hypothetical protein
MMPRLVFLLCAGLAGMSPTHADTLYKCKDDAGSTLYTNQKGEGKNCVVLSRELPVTTVAPPPKAAPRTPTPGGFPRVDGDTQRGRDSDRRKILEQEFATEQQNLEKARKALSEGEAVRPIDEKSQTKHQERIQELRSTVTLHERNIEALKRELANIK